MMMLSSNIRTNTLLCCLLIFASCGHPKQAPKEQEIVQDTRQLDEIIHENIAERIEYINANHGVMEDSIASFPGNILIRVYEGNQYKPKWSSNGFPNKSLPELIQKINTADLLGLFPGNYHQQSLSKAWQKIESDSIARKDAALWAKVDVMASDAYLKMMQDLHFGMFPRDSNTLRKDSTFDEQRLMEQLQIASSNAGLQNTLDSLEPKHPGYRDLKNAFSAFKTYYQGLHWDTLPLEYSDTVAFRILLANRLVQTFHLDTSGGIGYDSLAIVKAVKSFQHEFSLYPDGIAGKKTIDLLNRKYTGWFLQYAVNMDRWRKLPDSLPARYLWVNVPAYQLDVYEDSIPVVHSRIIVGTSRNKTPLLASSMTNFVLYPYWRVPYSIIYKEMLPKIKKDVNYLIENRLEVIDRNGEIVNPHDVDWQQLNKKHFPYVLRQVDGEDNSLGIIKFNFSNRHSVYLHDTNNRNLFKNSFRSLSHGCVRVQNWDTLAMYLVKDDTSRLARRDSVRTWLVRGAKKQVNFKDRLPIFIRYFTAVAEDKHIRFYEDIYGMDRSIIDQYKLIHTKGKAMF